MDRVVLADVALAIYSGSASSPLKHLPYSQAICKHHSSHLLTVALAKPQWRLAEGVTVEGIYGTHCHPVGNNQGLSFFSDGNALISLPVCELLVTGLSARGTDLLYFRIVLHSQCQAVMSSAMGLVSCSLLPLFVRSVAINFRQIQ